MSTKTVKPRLSDVIRRTRDLKGKGKHIELGVDEIDSWAARSENLERENAFLREELERAQAPKPVPVKVEQPEEDAT